MVACSSQVAEPTFARLTQSTNDAPKMSHPVDRPNMPALLLDGVVAYGAEPKSL
jgi:hypothetical protein